MPSTSLISPAKSHCRKQQLYVQLAFGERRRSSSYAYVDEFRTRALEGWTICAMSHIALGLIDCSHDESKDSTQPRRSGA